MTLVDGSSVRADGQQFVLKGRVLDATTGQPVASALVEFWQACATGKYNHPRDPNSARLDPNFQYWSQVRTDQQGNFTLRTIVPGAYPASDTWTRPAHIHVKVHRQGYPSLTTQLYFEGDPYNADDRLLQSLTEAQQKLVIVSVPNVNSDVVPETSWTIYIEKFRSVTDPSTSSFMATPEVD
jgi:protocatechuate 3,4-dioxygenase beta subunit